MKTIQLPFPKRDPLPGEPSRIEFEEAFEIAELTATIVTETSYLKSLVALIDTLKKVGRGEVEVDSDLIRSLLFKNFCRGVSLELVLSGHGDTEERLEAVPKDIKNEQIQNAMVYNVMAGQIGKAIKLATIYFTPLDTPREEKLLLAQQIVKGIMRRLSNCVDPEHQLSAYLESALDLLDSGYSLSPGIDSLIYILPKKHHEFILNIFKSFLPGNRRGQEIMNALVGVYGESPEDFSNDRGWLGDFYGTYPQLFSRESLLAIKARKDSKTSIHQIVKEWDSIRASICSGDDLTDAEKHNPLLPSILYEVYQPYSFTVSDIKSLMHPNPNGEYELRFKITDHQDHSLAFQFPQGGYPLHIQNRGRIVLAAPHEVPEAVDIAFALASKNRPFATTANAIGLFEIELKRDLLWCASHHQHVRKAENLLAALYVTPFGSRLIGIKNELDKATEDRSLFTQYRTTLLINDFFLSALPEGLDLALSHFLNTDIDFAQRMAKQSVTPDTQEAFISEIALGIQKHFNISTLMLKNLKSSFKFEPTSKQSHIRAFLLKRNIDYLARSGAELCTFNDRDSWNNPNYEQLILIDPERKRVTGVHQLNLFDHPHHNRSMLVRINPYDSYLREVDPVSFTAETIKIAKAFAIANGITPMLPMQGNTLSLTNRHELSAHLQAWYDTPVEVDIVVGNPPQGDAAHPLVVKRAFLIRDFPNPM